MRAILLLIVVLTACMHRVFENKEEQTSSKQPIMTRNNFSVYWDGLGQALRDNDTFALDKFLDTIVIFYGREDQDPKFELKNRERIIKVREIYLTGGFYDFQNDTNISYVDFFLNKKAFKSDYVEGQDIQNIKDFVFTRNKWNDWKLTAVYNNTKNVNPAGVEIPSVPRK